jgi:hypothetical protein
MAEARRESAADSVRIVSEWVTADRVRVFGVAAAGALIACTFVFLVIPYSFFTLMVAGVLAVVAGSAALLAGMTWWAEREGRTEGSQLWDRAEPGDRPEDLLVGFQSFHEDGDSD